MPRFLCMTIAACSVITAPAFGEIREYLLGDIDDFVYEGAGSEDDVYVDPLWQGELQSEFPSWTEVDFDQAIPGASMVPFTFQFDLLSGEVVADAWLEFRLAPRGFGGGPLETDRIYFDSVELSYLLGDDLEWDFTDSVLILNLASVGVGEDQHDDLRPLLQDGQLNCMVQDDSKVDYATLTLSIVPEPATLSLLLFGALVALKHRR